MTSANESNRNDRSPDTRVPRSEPQASGESHKAAARLSNHLRKATQ
jgi:hypothetical protein